MISEIENGKLAGKINYKITELPQSDFDISGSYDSGYKAKVKPNTVSSKVIESLKEIDKL